MIQDKPFVFSELLRRTIFLGRPNFFNAKDMNKEMLIVHSFIEEFNKVFAIHSTVKFKVTTFSETLDTGTNLIDRQIGLQWGAGDIMYKGIKFPIAPNGIAGYSQMFTPPNEDVSPRGIRPNTYIVLTAELATVTYADNPVLCGIQADEIIASAPTVNVEQYKNVAIIMTEDVTQIENVIGVLATIHPRYTVDGVADGTGFMYHTFSNEKFLRSNGKDRQESDFAHNETMYEFIAERVIGKLSLVLNERQLVRRFNFSDLGDFAKARTNLGFSDLVNRRQLVKAENLADLPDKARARKNMGLGNGATRKLGTGTTDLAHGNIVPVGGIIMWSGARNKIPVGWALCEGGTANEIPVPDLRGKFIVAVDPQDDKFSLVGQTGGDKTSLIKIENLPEHTHSIKDEGHSHSLKNNILKTNNIPAGGEGNDDTLRFTAADSDSVVNATTGIEVNKGGGVETPTGISILPPYYAMCFIMYVGLVIVEEPELPEVEPLEYPNYSTPDNSTNDGYNSYTPKGIGESTEIVGAGIILTIPK